MSEKDISKMDRTDLILAVQGYLKDPAIKAEDLSNFTLRNILIDLFVKKEDRKCQKN